MAESHAGRMDSDPDHTPVAILTITDKEFSHFRDLILATAGISLNNTKRDLVCARLSRRLRALGLRSFSQYHDYLQNHDDQGQEILKMINCITTNKTDFFRENLHFQFLTEQIVPQIRRCAARGAERKIRVWSAGCSTGDEAYSIAITLREALDAETGWNVKILASDIDTDALATACCGIYSASRLEPVPLKLRWRYFLLNSEGRERQWTVKPELRDLVVFRRINLIETAWPIPTRFDVIFCRNVGIYFNRETQQRLFERLAGYLSSDGYLIVGHSENLQWLGHLFEPIRGTIYRLRPPGDKGCMNSSPNARR